MKLKKDMIVVVKDNAPLKEFLKKEFPFMLEEDLEIGLELLPSNLVSKVVIDIEFIRKNSGKGILTITDINDSTVPAEIIEILDIRKATKREEFLYHIAGKPTVVEE